MRLLGLTGQARAGKTHVANQIMAIAFSKGFVPELVSFADPIKMAAKEQGLTKEKDHVKYRKFCQEFGATKRADDPDFFLDEAKMRIVDAMENENLDISRGEKYWERILIIDDVRYQNEVDMILRQGGQLMHVYAGERLPYPRARWRNHESEKLAKSLDKTQGVQHRIERFFNVKMPWDGPVEHDMYWLNNETTVEDLNKMIKLVAPFVLGIKMISAADKEEVYLNDMSEEEREELFREIAQALHDLFDKANDQFLMEEEMDFYESDEEDDSDEVRD
tara:strand:+ start:1721 stop:2551 length:831 start_codon:yes stop_codon:yes gene_type:complete